MAMKGHLDLIGKSLAGAGLTGIVLYIVATATQHSWPYLIFIGMLLLGGLIYFLSQRSAKPKAVEAENADQDQQAQPDPAFIERWRHTSNGAEAPGLMMINHKGFSHPGYLRQSSDNKPPFVRIGVLVACDPLGERPTTSELRERFLAFLDRSPVSELIHGLTYVADDLSWRSYASNGRINNEAILSASDDQNEAPGASAMMILNEAGLHRYGHDGRVAELVLHIEPREKDGSPAQAMPFKTWYEFTLQMLGAAGAFAQYLAEDVGVATYDDPPSQVGVELTAQRSLKQAR